MQRACTVVRCLQKWRAAMPSASANSVCADHWPRLPVRPPSLHKSRAAQVSADTKQTRSPRRERRALPWELRCSRHGFAAHGQPSRLETAHNFGKNTAALPIPSKVFRTSPLEAFHNFAVLPIALVST